MKVYIQLLRHTENSRKALRTDGWMFENGPDDYFLARHPQVNDEPAARTRLHRLGLLTSASLRIEFPLPYRISERGNQLHAIQD